MNYKDDGIDIRQCGFIYITGDRRTVNGDRCVVGKPVSKEPNPVEVYTAHNVFAGFGKEPMVAMVRPYNETMRKRFMDENADDAVIAIDAIASNELEVMYVMDLSSIDCINYLMVRSIGDENKLVSDDQKIIDLRADDDNLLTISYIQYPFVYRVVVRHLDPDMKLGLDEIGEKIRKVINDANTQITNDNGGILL